MAYVVLSEPAEPGKEYKVFDSESDATAFATAQVRGEFDKATVFSVPTKAINPYACVAALKMGEGEAVAVKTTPATERQIEDYNREQMHKDLLG